MTEKTERKCYRCDNKIGEHDPAVRIHPYEPERVKDYCYDCYIQWIIAGRPDEFPYIFIR